MKSILKSFLLGLAIVLTAPWWLTTRVLGNERFFVSSSQLFSLVPGLTGVFLRRGFHRMTLESFSSDCFVEFGTWFSHREVRTGRNVYIGGHCLIGMCEIGDNVLIGSNVDIPSGKRQHDFSNPERPINQQGGTFEKISIGEDCWIGNGALVVANIEPGCVIGAGSVVVNPVPAWSIVAGNPATVVKSRKRTD